MRKDKYSNRSPLPVNHVSEEQIRLTQAEISDSSGELPELDLHGETANQASVEVYDYIISMNAAAG